MAVTAADLTWPRTYIPGEVESLTFYEEVPVSKLVAVPKPPEAALEKSEIPEVVRKTVTDRAKSFGKAYGMDVSGALGISASDHQILVSHSNPDSSFFELRFNPEGNQVIFAMIMNVRLENATTPEQIGKRFADFHRQAFGFDLPAERPPGDRIRVERAIDATFAQWRVIVDGALLKETIIQANSVPTDGRWSIHGGPCPTSSEIEEIAGWFQKKPTKLTEAEAVAIAWKNWKMVRDTKDAPSVFQITCQLRKGLKEERDPWGVFGVTIEPKAWKNLAAVSDSPDPVFYEVKITGEPNVSILVDRMDGRVIRVHQGKVSW